MEQAEQQMPQKIMSEIVRWHNKLVEQGLSNKTLVAETTTEIINDKLVYTDSLKVGNTVLAQTTRIDNRPLAEIKTQLEAEKAKVQEQSDALIAKADEVLAAVEPKISKSNK